MKLLFAKVVVEAQAAPAAEPPRPLGIGLWPVGRWRAPRYLAFGHGAENTTTSAAARATYRGFLREGYTTVWGDAKLELEAIRAHWRFQWPRLHHDFGILRRLCYPSSVGGPRYHWSPVDVREELAAARDAMKHLTLITSTDPELRQAYNRERRLSRLLAAIERRGVPLRHRQPVYLRFEQLGTLTGEVTSTPDLLMFREYVWAGDRRLRLCGRTYVNADRDLAARWRSSPAHAPGARWLRDELEAKVRRGDPVYSVGGRRYHFGLGGQPLLVLTRASLADNVKQAALEYHRSGADGRWPLIALTADTLLATAPPVELGEAQAALRAAMAGTGFEPALDSVGWSSAGSWDRRRFFHDFSERRLKHG